MRSGRKTPIFLALVVGVAACAQEREREPAMEEEAAGAEMEAMRGVAQTYPNLSAPVVFENDRVVAQRTISVPGQWAGEHSHTGNQLAVVLKGGSVTLREGGEETSVTYEDGDVFWVEPTEAHDHADTSDAPFEAVLITIAAMEAMGGVAQTYPNLPANVVFENDRVVVQRWTSEPGVWAGEHSHSGAQLAVVLKGGTLTYREGGEETQRTFEDGQVFWIDALDAHDHAGDSRVDAVLIAIK